MHRRRTSRCVGGEGGIRTRIRCRIHAFQACAFGRSATSPDSAATSARERTPSRARRIRPRERPRPLRAGGSGAGCGPGRRANGRARLRIRDPIHQAVDARVDERARAHGTRLQRGVDGGPGQPPTAQRSGCLLQRQDLGVGGGIATARERCALVRPRARLTPPRRQPAPRLPRPPGARRRALPP